MIAIIFQQEIRRFLLLLGNTTLRQRSQFLGRILARNLKTPLASETEIEAIHTAILRLSRRHTGALIVIADDAAELTSVINTGVRLEALISQNLLESIFNKTSPLHDGAVIIGKDQVIAASCILPVSEKTNLPSSAGLRHRAALGVSEKYNVSAYIVSEETGRISHAKGGQLSRKLKAEQVLELLKKEMS